MFSFIKYHPVEYGSEQYPVWADVIGWMMPLSTNLPILVVALLVVYSSPGNTIIQVTITAAALHTCCLSSAMSRFYRAMQYIVQSAVFRSHVFCLSVCVSVCPSVCDVGGPGPRRLKILETNCTNN